ncbi:hypothetical protein E2C01_010229 [Portunus trituberculatus]|uniref:Uncharacterized protein n=1 Tax=Portunus trituberculatus TaxID=210409 RepID=A0A5B7D7X4_PORTR|nr:hypothetical protein [Portunus trituberculatus]
MDKNDLRKSDKDKDSSDSFTNEGKHSRELLIPVSLENVALESKKAYWHHTPHRHTPHPLTATTPTGNSRSNDHTTVPPHHHSITQLFPLTLITLTTYAVTITNARLNQYLHSFTPFTAVN